MVFVYSCFCLSLPVFRQKTVSCLQGRNKDADVENGRMETAGEAEGELNWESSMDVYPLPCVKQTASGDLLSSTGSSAWCCDDLEGWGGGAFNREGIYEYLWLIHFIVQQRPTRHSKANIFQFF